MFFFKRFYLFIFREGEGREKEKERNISLWLPLTHPQLGTRTITQVCALTGNQTGDPLVHRPALNPLSHTRQRFILFFKKYLLHFFHYHLVPLYPPPRHNHHTVVHVHESFFLFALPLHSLTSPHLAVILLSICESVSIFLVSSVCSLDSTYE